MSRAAGRTVEMTPNGATKQPVSVRQPRLPKSTNGAAKPQARKPFVEDGRISSGDKHLEWISVELMRISERSQRAHDSASSKAKIADIADNFDPDKFGTLTVNLRDEVYYIIDGGHRYLGVIRWFGDGWETQKLQCWTYHGLTEAEEADKFLALNDVKPVSGMDKFQRALVARHETEVDINRIVLAAELKIGTGRDGLGCIGAISKTYAKGGAKSLAQTLRIVRDSFGMPGFSSRVTEGMGLFVTSNEKYGFDETILIQRLRAKKGGVVGLSQEAENIKAKYGTSKTVAIAAVITETYNRGRGTKHLPSWLVTLNPPK
jgi:hypothetical protein